MSMKQNLASRSSRAGIFSDDRREITSRGAIVIGKVKEILGKYGEIRVWILGSTSTDEKNEDGWITVRYASPFMGFTSGDPVKSDNTIEFTKQTYGMSMIIPDVDNLVLCAFPETDTRQEGYWFASISNNLSNHSLPAHGSISYGRIDPKSIDPKIGKLLSPSGRYPVGETNEYIREGIPFASDFIDKAQNPLNPELTFQFISQGLDSDQHRGVISSSSQRLGDSLPSVFGISTPGRLKERGKQRRLAGHTFVMDDGDETGNNQLVRWRTAAGHQLLMNDNLGVIYISNASGLSWVELSATGDIQIYGAKDFSLRTQGNVEIHADRTIRMDATDIQMFSKNSMQLESDNNFTMRTEKNFNQHSGEVYSINVANRYDVVSGGVANLKSSGEIDIKGSKIYLNSSSGKAVAPEPLRIQRERYPDAIFDPNQGWAIQNDMVFSICEKVPTHEPYLRIPFESYQKAITELVKSQEAASKGSSGKVQSKSDTTNKISASAPTGGLPSSEGLVDGAISSAGQITSGLSNLSGTSINASTQALLSKSPNIAPDSIFKTQPQPPESITGLQKQETQAYMAQIAHTESGGKYDAVNQFGYAGKYQMGSLALQDAGLLKPGTPQSPEALNNPDNWIGGAGKPNSLEEFLSNQELQERTMVDYTNRNLATLKRTGALTDDSTTEEISGALAAAHLVGAGGATKLIKTGLDPQDGNGTKASQYYANGKAAIKKATSIANAEQAKNQLGA